MTDIKVPKPKNRKKSPPKATEAITGNTQKTPANGLEPLSFKASPEFVKEFKMHALEHNLKLIDLLKESFELHQKKTAGMLIEK